MISVEQLRSFVSPLPGVEESTQFGLPIFTVAGTGFLGLEKSRSTAVAAIDEDHAAALVAGHQDLYEEVWRKDTMFVGIRIDLSRAPVDQVRELVVAAWRNKAPRHLLTT
ncbi:MAG: MmcQ/YjbR family DNA-binding protein [Blastococcus sp.]